MFLHIIMIVLCGVQYIEGLAENIQSLHRIISAELGTTVTLQCSYKEGLPIFYLYKQSIGMRPQVVAEHYKYGSSSQFRKKTDVDPRLSVAHSNGILSLKISNITSSDSGVYYCTHHHAGKIEFGEGTLLILTGTEDSKHTIIQKPISYQVNQGDSVNFQCTVHASVSNVKHSVYWFRQGSGESHPGLIYSHGGRRDQCNKSSETDSPTQSCVYNLPKRNLSTFDAGTYYCAVALCGEILFGNGTRITVSEQCEKDQLLLYCLAATSAVSVILLVTSILIIISHGKITCCQKCRALPRMDNTFSMSMTNVQDGGEEDPDKVNYVALNLVNKKSKSQRQRTCNNKDIIYSTVLYQKSN